MKTRNLIMAAGAAALLVAGGCKKDDSKKAAPAPAPQPTAPQAGEQATAPAPAADGAAQAVAAIVAPYDTCRALLSEDETDGLADCAGALAAAAKANRAALPAEQKDHADAIAAAATQLAAAGDLEAARVAFAKASQPVVGLLAAVPGAAKQFHVFECPMAKNYKRWAQASPELANPYMGTKMQSCGSEVSPGKDG